MSIRPDPSDLFENAAWVRALALRLVGDAHAADDVVQDAWVVALQKRPRRADSLRAWLARVVRNLAIERRRAEGTRAARERRAARPERLESAADVAQRAWRQREIADAVLALDEPYRSTVLLRYFDELSAQEIARRQGVPGSTVRNRLRRALELLRERLASERASDWRNACLVAAGGPRAAAAIGGASMALQWKAGAAALALCALGGALWWYVADPLSREPSSAAEGGPARSTSLAAAGSLAHDETAPAPAPQSERAPVAAAATTAPADPVGVLLYGAAVDESNEPVAEARVTVLDAHAAERTADTDADGGYALTGLAAGPQVVRVEAQGHRPYRAELTIEPGAAVVRHDLRLTRAPSLPVRLVDPSGARLADVLRERDLDRHEPLVVASRTPPRERTASLFSARTRVADGKWHRHDLRGLRPIPGLSAQYDGRIDVHADLPAFVAVYLRGELLGSTVAEPGADELVIVADVDLLAPRLAHVRGVVVDGARGGPLAGARVELEPRGTSATTDAEGRFEIASLVPGPYELSVRGGDLAEHVDVLDLAAGANADLGTIVLGPAATVRGRVVDETGAPLAARVSCVPLAATDLLWRTYLGRTTRAGADGSFSFERVPHGPVALWIADQAVHTAPRVVDAPADGVELVAPAAGKVLVAYDLEAGRALRCVVTSVEGLPLFVDEVTHEGLLVLALARGTYRLVALEDGRRLSEQSFAVSPGADEPVRLELGP